MTNPEHQDYARPALANLIEDSGRSLFLLRLSELSRKLAVKPTDFGRILQATVDRKFFEENGVKPNICKALFGAKSSRYLKIMISRSALAIDTFNDERSTDKKASIVLNVVEEDNLSKSLFVPDGKLKGHTKLTPKYMSITSSDCVALAATVETIAEQQGLIK